MNALGVTEAQRTALLAPNAGHNIILEPRRLQDGRLILNADILDDPYFADPSRPWAAILAGEQVAVEEQPNQLPTGEVSLEVQEAVAESLAEVRSQIVTLSEAELAEPEELLLDVASAPVA